MRCMHWARHQLLLLLLLLLLFDVHCPATCPASFRFYHGLPNLFLPDMVAATVLNLGSEYEPGPGDGSVRSDLIREGPFLYPVPNFTVAHDLRCDRVCGSQAALPGL